MRQFLCPVAPNKNGMLEVSGKDYKYLRQVLRIKSGDMISLRLPDETLENATVCSINENAKNVVFQICAKSGHSVNRGVQACETENAFSNTEYWLFQFVARPAKMEQIIRQAVECGVKYIVPVEGVFSQKQNVLAMLNGKKERIERIVREARQQSGSSVETCVMQPVSVEQAVELWKDVCAKNGECNNLALVLYERTEKTQSLHKVVAEHCKNSKKTIAAVAVGCEGGISCEEIDLLLQGKFVPVHFAVNILRCETASVYGLAALQSAFLEKELWEFKE